MKNVILFTIDTLRKDMLGCYGNTEGLTPFLDSIQDKCITFTNSHAVGPYTQASFPGILTSNYYLEYGREKKLNPKKTLISEALKRNGITTAGFHSNPYLCTFFGWNRGWDKYYDSMDDKVDDISPYIKGNVINEKVDQWLSGYITSQDYNPFFLWVHYMDVHEPYVPDQKHINQIDSSVKLGTDEMMKLFKDVVLKRDASNKETVDLLRKLYKAHVIEVDEYAEIFFDILKKHNLLENTVIIITSDHGDEFCDHGGLSHNGKMYSELVNVPFFIYDLSLEKGQKSDILISGADIPPTVLKLFSLEPEPNFKGQAILPIENYSLEGCYGEAIGKLTNKMQETDKPVYYYRKDNLKIIYRVENENREMYDLKEDPKELNNIADSSPLAAEMKDKLNAFINRNL